MDLFVIQIFAYGVLSNKALLPYAALFTIACETLLGAALLLRLRLRFLSFLAVQIMLLIFDGLILYGWFFNDLANCGCFGPIDISPPLALSKNLLFAIMGALAWWGYSQESPPKKSRFALLAGKYALSFLLMLSMSAYAYTQLSRPDPGDDNIGPFAQFDMEIDGVRYNLGEGVYLVTIISADCDHCMEEVPLLDQLLYLPELPPLVGLCYEEVPESMESFRMMTNTQIPLYSMGNQPMLYFSLIGDDSFRVSLIRDGWPLQNWDAHPPSYDELVAALKAHEQRASSD